MSSDTSTVTLLLFYKVGCLLLSAGSQLENSTMMNNSGVPYHGQRRGDLSSCEVTLLNQLNERRDSTTSTISSAYTMSRRSSGISPGYSSRRSSEASQFGANRHNNISSADSYDPISTDLSRRSSEASQCGGGGVGGGATLPSLLSLTPAQHYRLKAKYAAATGGAPPTPLPNMDRMSLRTRMALYSDSQEASLHQYHQPPTGTVPRRCSDMGYGMRSMMPHEVPGNLPRRASDPVRRPVPDPLSLPRVQRYNSMNNMNPLNVSVAERYQSLVTQGYTRSDGNLQHYPFAPRPPSISENVAMENMVMDGLAGGDQNGEDDLVLPDDMVQYLRSQNTGPSANNLGQLDYHPNHQNQGFQTSMAPPPSYYSQRRMAMVDAAMPHSGQDSQQPFPAPPDNMSKSNMPVQWNEVSSGTVDSTTKLSKQHHPLRGNLAVVPQRHNFTSFQGQGQALGSNQQVVPMSQNVSVQVYANHSGQRLVNVSQPQQQQQRQYVPVNFGEHMSPQQGFGQEFIPNSISGSTSMRPTQNGVASSELQGYRARTQTDGYSRINQMDLQQNYNTVTQQQQLVHSGGRGSLQPRPPAEPKSNLRQHPGSNVLHPNRVAKSSALSPCEGTETSEASPKRCGGSAAHNSSSENPMFYTGQIHMFEPSFDAPMSPCASEPPANSTAAANMASPGVNLVSSSTIDSSTGGPGGAQHPQIDFDTMLDDGDHSSLMSGTLSPGLLQSLSQSSSRLTTPRNSLPLASVPAGIGNMAIGDMNSMLTALAEESKFLNMMS